MKRFLYIARRKIIYAWVNLCVYLKPKGKKGQLRPLPETPKILFIINGLLGDTTMSTTAILAAKQVWPNSSITVLAKKSNIDLLSGLSVIDNFIITSFRPFSIGSERKKREIKELIREEKFDVSIILLGDEFGKILYDANISVRVGVKGHILKATHTHLYDIISPREWGPAQRLNSLKCMGYEVSEVLPMLANDSETTSAWKVLKKQLAIPDEYFVLHPFGSTQRQWWPVEKISVLAKQILESTGITPVLIGGEETKNTIIHSKVIIDVRGKITLKELKIIIANAKLVISTDSGPYHIAGAFQKPTIGLFRKRRPELANIYPRTISIFGDDETCMKKCRWDYCRSEKCVQMCNISSDAIIEQILKNPVSDSK